VKSPLPIQWHLEKRQLLQIGLGFRIWAAGCRGKPLLLGARGCFPHLSTGANPGCQPEGIVTLEAGWAVFEGTLH
jgi:hypothetical protein